MTDRAALQAEHDAALQDLYGLKALCQGTCSEADAAIADIPLDARAKAAVAHHVMSNDDPLSVAFAAGRGVSPEYLATVHEAVKAGGDPIETTGADPAHVELLATATAAHESHRERLEAAYVRFSAASAALAATEAPSTEAPAIVGSR